jgi:hypothetical protein
MEKILHIDTTVDNIFCDNETNNIRSVESEFTGKPSPKIDHCVLVDDTTPNELIKLSRINVRDKNYAERPYSMIPDFKLNVYAQSYGRRRTVYTPSNGITFQQLEEIERWIHEKTLEQKLKCHIFLDWDRTISVVEGLNLPYKTQSWKSGECGTVNDALLYLMGGSDRLQLLRDFFASMVSQGVKIIIVTNNGWADTAEENIIGRNLFLELIQNLMPSFMSENLLYSGLGSIHDRNKGKCIAEYFKKEAEELEELEELKKHAKIHIDEKGHRVFSVGGKKKKKYPKYTRKQSTFGRHGRKQKRKTRARFTGKNRLRKRDIWR